MQRVEGDGLRRPRTAVDFADKTVLLDSTGPNHVHVVEHGFLLVAKVPEPTAASEEVPWFLLRRIV